MTRLVLCGLVAAILLVPATAQGHSGVRIRGTVALKDAASHVVTLRAARQAVALRVPGSLALIRVGMRVELRGSTLRRHGNGSRILARNVTIELTQTLSNPSAPIRDEDDEVDDDEVEIEGMLVSLNPLTVRSATRTVTCAVPAGVSLAGFGIGDFVEITCDLQGGAFVLRVLEHEDEFEDEDEDRADREDDDDDNSGPGGGGHGG